MSQFVEQDMPTCSILYSGRAHEYANRSVRESNGAPAPGVVRGYL